VTRTLALGAVALALLAAAAVSVAAPAQRGRPTAVGVGEREWRIALYRSRVPTGRVKFNVRNYGEDGHDLAVRTRSGRRLATLPEVKPGETGSLTVRLHRRGRYVVFCSLAGHEQLGMRALLRVVRASVRGRPSRPPPARRRR
jgi:plastocyanin